MIGQRFERIMVLARAGRGKNGKHYYLCLCDCGQFSTSRGDHLRLGKTLSCGCLGRERLRISLIKHGRCIGAEAKKQYDKERSAAPKVRAFLSQYRKTDRHKNWFKAYTKSESYKTAQRNHRHRKRTAERAGFVSKNEWAALLEASGFSCRYCGKTGCEITMDHLIPVSKGGKHCITNIAPACRSCNSGKNAISAIDYLSKKGTVFL